MSDFQDVSPVGLYLEKFIDSNSSEEVFSCKAESFEGEGFGWKLLPIEKYGRQCFC